VLGRNRTVDNLSLDCFETHAGKENDEDCDDGSRTYASGRCGVLCFAVVAE
jgi:hypothetical protein